MEHSQPLLAVRGERNFKLSDWLLLFFGEMHTGSHSSFFKVHFLNGCFSDDTNGSFMLTGALLAQRCFNIEQRNIVYGDMN